MKVKSLIAIAFAAGITLGAVGNTLIAPANAGDVVWSDVAKDPAFRQAVAEVINACIVQNSIIYCE
jgi:hypothetical protein